MDKNINVFKAMDLQLFAEEAETVEPKETVEQGATDEAKEAKPGQPLTAEMVQKMIQSENDKVRTEYTKKLKAVESEKEEILKKSMSDEEKRQYELDQMQKQLEEKEQAITTREMTIKTVDLLKDNDMPLEFRDFITATSEEELTEKITKLKTVWNEALKQHVEGTFKAGGREPQRNMQSAMTELQKLEDAYNKATTNQERVRLKMQMHKLQNNK